MFYKWLICAILLVSTPGHLFLNEIQERITGDGYILCDEGWFLFGEKCYRLFGGNRLHDDRISWDMASKRCENYGGHLTTVQSKEVQDFLFVFLLLESDVGAWIGLNDRLNETQYEWPDGTEFSYRNWNVGEPSEHKIEWEDCVHMILQTGHGDPGKWNDLPCKDNRAYICQVDSGKQKKTSRDPLLCPPRKGGGWKFGDSCYNIVTETMTWGDAEKYCQDEYNGHLVTILNFQVDYFLNYIMANFSTDIWIGIKIKHEIQLQFSSGWAVVRTNWIKMPQVFVDGTCVVRTKGKWRVVPCTEEYPFICEVSTDSPPVLQNHKEGSKCPQLKKDWVDLNGDYCYFIETTNVQNWYRANFECLRRGGSLASIHSIEEIEALSPFVKNILQKDSGVFLGLYQPFDDENIFEWTDGSQMDFTYWNEGEPNSKHEKCAEAFAPNMLWNDVRCEANKGYICAVKKINPKVAETETECDCKCTDCITFKVITGVVCILFVTILLSVVLNYFRPWKKEKRGRRNNPTAVNVPLHPSNGPAVTEMFNSRFEKPVQSQVILNDCDGLYENFE